MHPETLKLQLGFTQWVVTKNCEELTHEDSLMQPASGGNCLNWLVGHIVAARQHMLSALDQKPVWSEKKIERYDRHSPPVTGPDDAEPLAEMLKTLAASLEGIIRGLDRVTPEQLAAKAPFSPTNNENETYGSLLAGLVFHEAYHTGQTSYWRRIVGKESVIK